MSKEQSKQETNPKKEVKKEAKKEPKKSILIPIILSLLVLPLISFLITNTLTFGVNIPFTRIKHILDKEITLSTLELLKYDGSNPALPIYLAINGKIYDVSAGASYYGPGGSYHFFSGKDATRAYITGCFQTHLTHDLRGLSDSQIKSLKSWVDFYENSSKYFYVGKVLHDPIDPKSPIPEDCNK